MVTVLALAKLSENGDVIFSALEAFASPVDAEARAIKVLAEEFGYIVTGNHLADYAAVVNLVNDKKNYAFYCMVKIVK